MILKKAIETIQAATTDIGICATSIDSENYKRVWSRDSTMAGIAGCLAKDEAIITAFKCSLNTLANHQHSTGFIPSNVGGPKVSYGSLVGRVDATLWYIIGIGIYEKLFSDASFLEKHLLHLRKTIALTESWEFNGRHLIYTPISGNWADEYPIQGYTLYDNCLRLWGYRLLKDIFPKIITKRKITAIETAIKTNFWLEKKDSEKYHPRLYETTLKQEENQYFAAGFTPSQYYRMFDAAGNGLAMLLNLTTKNQVISIAKYVESIFAELNQNLAPAFWPTIKKGSRLWEDLSLNYAYNFKNYPHHFHNGGIWPIMMGWLSMGFKMQQKQAIAAKMSDAYDLISQEENYTFSEYIASDNFTPLGKTKMCFSAAGTIFMHAKTEEIEKIIRP